MVPIRLLNEAHEHNLVLPPLKQEIGRLTLCFHMILATTDTGIHL